MEKFKACKNCRTLFITGSTCPLCNSSDITDKYSSQIIFFDIEKSQIAKKFGATVPGRYAVRVR
ncbi:MAG: transcription elongation factor subunit Spt4 [Candidatus Anstonellales archaeon]